MLPSSLSIFVFLFFLFQWAQLCSSSFGLTRLEDFLTQADGPMFPEGLLPTFPTALFLRSFRFWRKKASALKWHKKEVGGAFRVADGDKRDHKKWAAAALPPAAPCGLAGPTRTVSCLLRASLTPLPLLMCLGVPRAVSTSGH